MISGSTGAFYFQVWLRYFGFAKARIEQWLTRSNCGVIAMITRFPIVEMRRAALRYAQAYNSDPFAYSRAYQRMRSGLELPSDILEEANALLSAKPHTTTLFVGVGRNPK